MWKQAETVQIDNKLKLVWYFRLISLHHGPPLYLTQPPQGRTSDNSWQTIISCNSLEFIHQSQSLKNPWERFAKIWTQNWNSRLNLAVVCWLIILNETEKRRRQSTLLFFTMILKLLNKIRLQKNNPMK